MPVLFSPLTPPFFHLPYSLNCKVKVFTIIIYYQYIQKSHTRFRDPEKLVFAPAIKLVTTGTILSPKVVLTLGYFTKLFNSTVLVGYGSLIESELTYLEAEKWFPHHLYDTNKDLYNFGLIVLRDEFVFTKNIKPVTPWQIVTCITELERNPKPFQLCGWGKGSNSKFGPFGCVKFPEMSTKCMVTKSHNFKRCFRANEFEPGLWSNACEVNRFYPYINAIN